MASGKLEPNVRDAVYGPEPRHRLDLYKARSSRPTPVVVWFHGGGFCHGEKVRISHGLIRGLLKAGISVASANYCYAPPDALPKPMYDGARAVQFLRHQAAEWNLNPDAIAASGQSAGAGIALWVAFRDDLAEPQSSDPVARQSSRITCVGVLDAQTSYAPDFVRDVIGGKLHENPALPRAYGLTVAEADTPQAHKLYHETAPISFISSDDPPVWMYYYEPNVDLPPNASQVWGIHSPKFGLELQKRLQPLGVECTVKTRDDYAGFWQQDQAERDMVRFFIQHLRKADTPKNWNTTTDRTDNTDGTDEELDGNATKEPRALSPRRDAITESMIEYVVSEMGPRKHMRHPSDRCYPCYPSYP